MFISGSAARLPGGDAACARILADCGGVQGRFPGNRCALHEMTYYSPCLGKTGAEGRAGKLLRRAAGLRAEIQKRGRIDYFATSLPAMLLFDRPAFRQKRPALFLSERNSTGEKRGGALLRKVLRRDPNHALRLIFERMQS